MKKKKIISILLLLLFIHPLIYHAEEVRDHPIDKNNNEIDDIGWFTSLAIDSQGTPHISYYDYTNKNLKYCSKKDTSWEIKTIDSTGDVGKYTSIALDDTDMPHISYYDGTSGNLKYAYLENNKWQLETIDSLGNVGLYTSIKVDSKNYPHISYCQYDTRILKYAYFDGVNFKKTVVDASAVICADDYFCDYTSLALDKNDKPHISYCDYEHFDLKYAFLQGTNWNTEVVDSTGDVGVYSSIMIDANNNPHISYADFTYPQFDLKYAARFNDSWKIETIDSDGDIRKWTSLALDAHELPHISYYDYTKGSLEYLFFNGSMWQQETVEIEGSTGCFNSLYLKNDNTPCMSYYDWGEKSLKFASKQDNGWYIETIEKDTNTDFLDQEQTYCSGYATAIQAENPLAQRFIPQYLVLTRVELMLVKRYQPGDFTISLRKELNGEDLTKIHVTASDIPEDIAWKPFDIPDIAVQTNESYYLICTAEETQDYNLYFWYFGHNDPYLSGDAWKNEDNRWEMLEIFGFPYIDFGFKTFGLNTTIPNIPTIDGPTTGSIGVSYNYTIAADDADNDQLFYEVQWNQDEKETIGPFPPGEKITLSHTWHQKGTYLIHAKAIDTAGAESQCNTLKVTIPKNKVIHRFLFFNYLLEHFLLKYPFSEEMF